MTRRARVLSAGIALITGACATTRFDQYLKEQRWTDAAAAFAADSSLFNNEDALYRAGILFGTPGRPTYDPARAHDLLSALIARFPSSGHRADAVDRLGFVDEVLQAHGEAAARQRQLETQIAAVSAQLRELSSRLDSAIAQRDSLRGSIGRLEQEKKERDDQLHALRLELQRIKEIDLKPRKPPVTR